MGILIQCPVCRLRQAKQRRKCKCGENLITARKSGRVKFWIDYRFQGKRRCEYVGSFPDLNGYSPTDAEKAYAKRLVQKAEKAPLLAIRPETKKTFKDLVDRYEKNEKVSAFPSFWRVKLALNAFCREFGSAIVNDILPEDIENYQARRKAEGKADRTVDYELVSAKAVIRKAFENDLVSKEVLKRFRAVEKLLKPFSNSRDRVLSVEEFNALIEKANAYLRPILEMGYWTGMRRGEIVNLIWDKVYLKNRTIRLGPDDTKTGEGRTIPISKPLLETLKSLPMPIRPEGKPVFLYRGEPMHHIRESLKNACRKAGLQYGRKVLNGFCFHDLRHTFITHMRAAGVPTIVIKTISGHAMKTVFDSYDTVTLEDKKEAMARLESYRGNQVATTTEESAK